MHGREIEDFENPYESLAATEEVECVVADLIGRK
jgi:hypothetical protein